MASASAAARLGSGGGGTGCGGGGGAAAAATGGTVTGCSGMTGWATSGRCGAVSGGVGKSDSTTGSVGGRSGGKATGWGVSTGSGLGLLNGVGRGLGLATATGAGNSLTRIPCSSWTGSGAPSDDAEPLSGIPRPGNSNCRLSSNRCSSNDRIKACRKEKRAQNRRQRRRSFCRKVRFRRPVLPERPVEGVVSVTGSTPVKRRSRDRAWQASDPRWTCKHCVRKRMESPTQRFAEPEEEKRPNCPARHCRFETAHRHWSD